MITRLFILLLTACPCIIQAQPNYVFQHLTTKDGLASENIAGILHDSHGFTWVGTDKGLQKFDGNSFTDIPYGDDYLYTSVVSATTFLPVLEDKMGNIWVRTNNIVSVYSPLTGKINRIEIDDDINIKGFDPIRSFCKDNKGEVWILTTLNLYKYDNRLQKPVFFLSLGDKPLPYTNLVFDNDRKGFWMIRYRQILFLNIDEKKAGRTLYNYFQKLNIPDVAFSWIDSKQNIWISDWNGYIFRVNILSKVMKAYLPKNYKTGEQKPNTTVHSFIEDDKGIIWAGSEYGGLFYYDELKDQFTNLPSGIGYSNSLHYDINTSVSKDNDGNIWVGTDKGISIFNPSYQQFQTIDENNVVQSFEKAEVTQIFETSKGDILIGTWGNGWFIYDKHFRYKKRFYNKVTPVLPGNTKNQIWCFAEAPDGKIWIGHQYGLLGIYDPINQSISYSNDPGFNLKTIRVVRCDALGNMWFGLHSGSLAKWDRQKNKYIFYNNIFGPDKDKPATISDILICPNGDIWLATYNNGFCRFDRSIERIAEHYTGNKDKPALDNNIYSLTLINDSVIGIATASKGFILFNYWQKTFTSVTKKRRVAS